MFRTIQCLFVLFLVSCNAPLHSRPRTLYRDARRDMANDGGTAALMSEVRARMEQRYAKVNELFELGLIQKDEDMLFAAALLVTSDDSRDLDRALLLADEAASLGERRALTIAAEAEDKLLLKRGLPQRYGTQYAYEPARGRWRLYAVDPNTTDADRASVGLPPLATMQARVDELDGDHLTKLLVSRGPE